MNFQKIKRETLLALKPDAPYGYLVKELSNQFIILKVGNQPYRRIYISLEKGTYIYLGESEASLEAMSATELCKYIKSYIENGCLETLRSKAEDIREEAQTQVDLIQGRMTQLTTFMDSL